VKTRIAGVLSILAGLAGVVAGVWGFGMTERMASLPAPEPFDASDWSLHWRVSSVLIIVLGVGSLAAGGAMFRRRRLGFALLLCVAVTIALVPRLLYVVGFSRYAFEQPGVLESVVSLAVAVSAFIAYRRFEASDAAT
jgi:hypothetical protein